MHKYKKNKVMHNYKKNKVIHKFIVIINKIMQSNKQDHQQNN